MSFSGGDEKFFGAVSLHEEGKEIIAPNGDITFRNARGLELQDISNETLITLESSRSFDGRITHVRSGFSGNEEYQSTCVMPLFYVSLEAGKTWKTVFSLKFSSLP